MKTSWAANVVRDWYRWARKQPPTLIGSVDLTSPARVVSVRSCLVLGGARSGKSGYALALAERSRLCPVYLATATVWDDEMRDRVHRHRDERNSRWRTVEEPLALVDRLQHVTSPEAIVVVDCLTLWLTNVMLAGSDAGVESKRLAEAIGSLLGPVIFVSNEVGSGIVPDNALARAFRDAQGRLNQVMARACEAAVLVVAGLPLALKPGAAPRFDILIDGADAAGTVTEQGPTGD